MTGHVDPLRVSLQVGLYIFFYVFFLSLLGLSGLVTLLGMFAGSALGVFISAVAANVLTLRIYEGRKLADIGFHWNPTSAHNLAWGLIGGVVSALAVLSAPLAFRAASLQPGGTEAHWRIFVWVVLLRSIGPFATVLPVGALFGALHTFNPHSSLVSVLNTAGFGILFGYAFLRSRDLWLPFGLHYGWNLTLPLFGASVSGIKMGVLG